MHCTWGSRLIGRRSQLVHHGNDLDGLLRSARAVVRHRGVTLERVAPHLAGYGAVAQAKWAAWRRRERPGTGWCRWTSTDRGWPTGARLSRPTARR